MSETLKDTHCSIRCIQCTLRRRVSEISDITETRSLRVNKTKKTDIESVFTSIIRTINQVLAIFKLQQEEAPTNLPVLPKFHLTLQKVHSCSRLVVIQINPSLVRARLIEFSTGQRRGLQIVIFSIKQALIPGHAVYFLISSC